MKIAIIGKGQVGGALARTLGRAGHEIVFGSRSPEPGATRERTVAGAVADAVVTILAVPFGAVGEIVTAAGGFDGKILIDATNPLAMGTDGLGLSLGFETSGAEAIQRLAPQAKLFKTFNQTGFENMAEAGAFGARPVMFVAGDDATAKPIVLRLVEDAGLEAVDAGELRNARLLEPLAMLWIDLALKRGFGTRFAFSLQRR